MQSKIENLEKVLDNLWQKSNTNEVLATDMTVYICDLANCDEPNWEDFGAVDILASEVNSLSNLLLLDEDYKTNLYRFLHLFLRAQNYSLIYKFFDRAFVNHVCNTVFSSPNASQFSMAERSFDRFIEAVKFSEISVEEILPLIINAITCNANEPISKWRRPACDFMTDMIRQNKIDLGNYLTQNLAFLSVAILNYWYNVDDDTTLNSAVRIYRDYQSCRDIVGIFLKQHSDETIKCIEKAKSSNNLDMYTYVQILLLFSDEKNISAKLENIYHAIESAELKRMILDKVDVVFKSNIHSLAQFNKAVNKYQFEDNTVLGKKLSEYPDLISISNKSVLKNATQMLINKYIELCSYKAVGELSYFSEFCSVESLEALADDILNQYIKCGTADDDWALVIVSRLFTAPRLADAVAKLFTKFYKSDTTITQQLLDIVTTVRSADLQDWILAIDQNVRAYPQMVDELLKSMRKNNRVSIEEYQSLCDRLVPTYGLSESRVASIDTPLGEFKIELLDGQSIEVTGPRDVSFDTLSAKKQNEINNKKDAILREIAKQSNRLESAFYNNRRWSISDFENILLKNPILSTIAEGVLWAIYLGDNIASVFSVTKGKRNILVMYKNLKEDQGEVGIFHPVENNGQEWSEVFRPSFVPFNQLNRDVYHADNLTKFSSVVTRFNGTIVDFDHFLDRLTQLGWREGVPAYLGKTNSMLTVNEALGLLAEIDFVPVAEDVRGQQTMLGELRFYKIDSAINIKDTYKTTKLAAIDINAVPPRYFSDTVYDVARCSKNS